ncbi:SDR family NAD(P)-dependent oxidoreductase [Streptomyces sp. AJS327]|uniref:SDR family NAD(P)-dependent oxidoreductase n=1 Tax=Streptomyces sp. AJS327 TaxID=2545265 RepID=UPI0018262AFA|nr:SDR family NAD(P)-dependent oxidoreductase [Streptomyces sp. AJS327]MBA0052920.1 SDR family NAD(P)-dependent oxidoreductase [Streptomyces sp. AJS327]
MENTPRFRIEIVGVTPFAEPNARLVCGVTRAGGLGVLDLGRDPARAEAELAEVCRRVRAPFGVRVPPGAPWSPERLPEQVRTVLLGRPDPKWTDPATHGRRTLVEVVSLDEAREAVRLGADTLVVRGCESGGRIGTVGGFVLLQQVLAADLGVPVLAAGGLGPHTAAAAVAGGADGVVLDSQLALVAESAPRLPEEVAAAVRAMDGTETTVLAGHRVYTRPGLDLGPFTDAPYETVTAALACRLRDALLPVGQDGAFAAPLADRHRTAGGVVQAFQAAITTQVESAVSTAPLAPGSAFAHATGLERPLLQGPMTRVSDRAAFARSVAEEGGLPFLALALLGGEETHTLLSETSAALGDRPWGAGILGFAPREVREAQLTAIREVRPPFALLAGGRPDQAAALERSGTRTFLHVPTPGLLDQFLRAGARSFVFEGRECGGHVGPLGSFPLWEAQLTRLLDFTDQPGNAATELRICFAGGVHDARSAAMVATLAAPLAERGAAVGVLMGTGYLLTEEAVRHGAIRPGYQRTVLDCDRTTLLETAPGHATRCVETPYVREHAAAAHAHRTAGTPREAMWAELERLNLGRLRLAAKGRRREGAVLREVDEHTQAEEGMFMVGEVAALRHEPTTVRELHESVSEGGARLLAARAAELRRPATPTETAQPRGERAERADTDIAIVGMSCVYPDAPDAAGFWANILAGTDAVREVDPGRWDPRIYHRPHADGESGAETTVSKWGGFLPPVPFDPLRYGLPPAALGQIDPAQLLALRCAEETLADAGYTHRPFSRERTSVIFGAEHGSDLAGAQALRMTLPSYLGELPPELASVLPGLTGDSFAGVLSNVIAGRIANRLDFGGVNFTVEAACASSFAALDAARKELLSHTSDLVLCGAVDLHNGAKDYLLFSSVGALSPTGRCRSFDAGADGIALGEGVACLALKRLADAERDGDRIYAVVRGVGGSSDGRSLGLTAPRPEGQRRALRRAYEQAGLPISRLGLIEAHGTGTVVGDRTELDVLTELCDEEGAAAGSVTLGSVKSMIGHTKCAAGMAGLIKATRAIYSGVLPPTAQLRRPNPAWSADTSPFRFDTRPRPWLERPAERHAGVSAFGFGGTNFHVVVSGYDGAPEPTAAADQWPAELFCLRGADRAEALRRAGELAALLEENDRAGRPWRLRDLARTVSTAWAPELPVRLALVASDLDELGDRLHSARTLPDDPAGGVYAAGPPEEPATPADPTAPDAPGATNTPDTPSTPHAPNTPNTPGAPDAPGKVAFLFPGQGSQRPGMLTDLFVTFPALRELLPPGSPWAEFLFPPATFDQERRSAQRAAITDTRVAQPVLGVAGLAVHRLLGRLGVVPDLVGGHSYGELVALSAAGAFGAEELLRLSQVRAEAVLEAAGAEPGAMLAVTATPEEVTALLGAAHPDVVLANHNAPRQTVLAGPAGALASAAEPLRRAGLPVAEVPVACAFHSPTVAGARAPLASALEATEIAPPRVPVWSNTDARPYPHDPGGIRATLTEQVARPVRFAEQIEAMYRDGARIFVEAGPGRTLTGLVGAVLGDRPHTAVSCDVPGEPGLNTVLHSLARLAVAGVPLDCAALFEGRDAVTVTAGAAPPPVRWTVDGQLVRDASGRPVPGGLLPATEHAVTLGGHPAAEGGQPGPREAALVEYLRGTRELVTAQRDVLMSYLGAAPSPAAGSPAGPPEPTAHPPVVATTVRATLPEQAGPPEGPPSGVGGSPRPAPMESQGAALSAEEAAERVLGIVSERTGYPRELLGSDIDLEADLSIDSIKRTEIVGELAQRLRLSGDDTDLEELSRLKTVRSIAEWCAAATGAAPPTADPAPVPVPAPGGAPGPRSGHPAAPASGFGPTSGPPAGSLPEHDPTTPPHRTPPDHVTGPVPSSSPDHPADSDHRADSGPRPSVSVPPRRFLLQETPLDPPATAPDQAALHGARCVVVDDSLEVGRALADGLEALGASAVRIAPATSLDAWTGGGADTLVYLAALTPGEPALPRAYAPLRSALLAGYRRVLVVTGLGGRHGRTTGGAELLSGVGLAGAVRTMAREYPDTAVRLVDVDPKTAPGTLARWLLAELGAPDGPPVVGYPDGTRTAWSPVAVEPVHETVEPTEAAAALGLSPESVVLLTGGARGITGRVAVELARASGCHLELAGRTPPPAAAEDPRTTDAPDEVALRRLLAADGGRTPVELDAEVRRLLAEREVRAVLRELSTLSAGVRYHAVDVRRADEVTELVRDVHRHHGRIDGVVHGAGAVEDRLIRDKAPESFARVYSAKVDGARALAEAVAPHRPRFLAMFGSVSGVFGNPGQVDYAAANDALDALAHLWSGHLPGRVVTVDWGPWAARSGGMVTPALEQRYAAGGVGLIQPDDGVRCLLGELAYGSGAQVMYLCGAAEAFTGEPETRS